MTLNLTSRQFGAIYEAVAHINYGLGQGEYWGYDLEQVKEFEDVATYLYGKLEEAMI